MTPGVLDALSRSVSRIAPTAAKEWLRAARRAYNRTFRAFSTADLHTALRRLGIATGDLLMVHSSFDQLEGFRGSPRDVIQVLEEVVGPGGTLLMPALPFGGAVVDYVRDDPLFDPRRTPSRMGLITEVFRRSPGVSRSLQPTHSVVAWGRLAEALIADHHLADTPCGSGTPYGRLIDLDGKILFLGVPLTTMTVFHAVEERLEPEMPFPVFAPERYTLRRRGANGTVEMSHVRLFALPLAGHRDLRPLERELKRSGCWREQRVGRAQLTLVRAREVWESAKRLAARGVFCYDREVLEAHPPL